jgi:hypothetical protein
MKTKLIIVVLLLIILGWAFSDWIFPDGFSNFFGHLGDEIRDSVSF